MSKFVIAHLMATDKYALYYTNLVVFFKVNFLLHTLLCLDMHASTLDGEQFLLNFFFAFVCHDTMNINNCVFY